MYNVLFGPSTEPLETPYKQRENECYLQ